ncbi:MAG: hypothetical protein IK105_06255 [Thermoguttaceae bacterium]|nr:hypothetical protein [Thermoguttaceae bacterium]
MKKLANITNFESLMENRNGVNSVFNDNFSKAASEISADPMCAMAMKGPLSSSEFFRDMGSSSWRKKFGHLLRSVIDTDLDNDGNNQHNGSARRVVKNKKLPKESDGWGAKNILPILLACFGGPLPIAVAAGRLGSKGKDAKISDWMFRSMYGDRRTNEIIAHDPLKKMEKLRKKGAKGIAFDSFDALQQAKELGTISKDQFNQLLHDLYFKGSLYVPEDYDDPDLEIDRTMTPTLQDYVKNPKNIVLDDVDEKDLDPDAPGSLISKKLAVKSKKDATQLRKGRIEALRRVFPFAPLSFLGEMADDAEVEITTY